MIGSTALDDLLSKRDIINTLILKHVDAATSTWGIKVLRFEIKYVLPSEQLIDFMSVQMIAERTKRTLIINAEAKKQATILQAQGAKQVMILEAEAYKTATFRDSEARERFAQAEARAIEVISNAIDRGEIQSLNYLIAVKYVGAIYNLANSKNAKDMLMALETAGVINAVSGLKDIVKFSTLEPEKKNTKN